MKWSNDVDDNEFVIENQNHGNENHESFRIQLAVRAFLPTFEWACKFSQIELSTLLPTPCLRQTSHLYCLSYRKKTKYIMLPFFCAFHIYQFLGTGFYEI